MRQRQVVRIQLPKNLWLAVKPDCSLPGRRWLSAEVEVSLEIICRIKEN